MKIAFKLLLTLAGISSAALAAPQTFNFKDPKGVNNAVFRLDAPLEAINGSAAGISGTVTFDPANPGATQGKIAVASSSMKLGNATMQGHLQGEQWLDVTKHPEISFDVKELKNLKTTGDVTTADATGTFTLKGVAKELTIPIKLTYLKDKLGSRVQGQNGDLLVIRSNFNIRRSDFGINSGKMEDKVSDIIELTLSIAGASPR